MRSFPFTRRATPACTGAALVIVLLLLLLLTVLVIAFSDLIKRETRVSSLSEGSYRAETHARYALHVAMDRLRQAFEPFDDPFRPSASPPDAFWSLAPGLIVHYPLKISNTPYPAPIRTYPLHSGAPFDPSGTALDQTSVVDLNQRLPSGERPIDDTLPDSQQMAVAWQPILQDPSTASGPSNRLIGRYAFWIDDEGAKINLNTADGRHKYDGALSYGPGTPTEVDLSTLDLPDPTLSATSRDAIASRVLAGGFTLPGEVTQIPGVPANFPITNRFFLTTYSRSPEMNLFNEPRIQIIPTNLDHLGLETSDHLPLGGGDARSIFEGLFGTNGRSKPGNLLSQTPLRSIYPMPRQLSGPLRDRWFACPRIVTSGDTHRTDFTPLIPRTKTSAIWSPGQHQATAVGDLALQIAHYLNGINARNQPVEWPFPAGNYLAKYNQHQLDSIIVQLLDLSRMSLPQGRGFYNTDRHKRDINPTLAPFGILGNQPVSGLGRAPRFTEFYAELSAEERFDANTSASIGLDFTSAWYLELYYPMGALHPDRHFEQRGYSSFGGHYQFGHFSVNQSTPIPSILNSPDAPHLFNPTSYVGTTASRTTPATYWMDNYLVAKDQNGDPAGIDFWGNPSSRNDPDQARAELFRFPPTTARYRGKGPLSAIAAPMLQFNAQFDFVANAGTFPNWPPTGIPPGGYLATRSINHIHSYPTRDPVNGKAPVSQILFSGGLCVWLQYFGIDERGLVDFFPIQSLKGTANGGTDRSQFSTDAPTLADLIPLPQVTVAPGAPALIHGYVRDPWVNKNIGDWIISTHANHLTLPTSGFLNDAYFSIYHQTPNHGADDLAANWLTRDYNDTTQNQWGNWAHQSSLPSVGIFHYLRTKMMPDTGTHAGVPFRLLSFAPLTPNPPLTGPLANTQDGIPDWAMLDLFTIPQGIWRKPVSAHHRTTPTHWSFDQFFNGDYQPLTYGGATSGKINLNGTVLYPWADAPEPHQRLPYRLKPLQSVLIGLRYNQDGIITLDDDRAVTNLQGPITYDTSETLAHAIAETIRREGPLLLPGRICDIPEIAALGATVNPTRNDIVAQTLGNLTTQGNVFSIWVASQTIAKARSNPQHDTLEPGDEILSTRRMRFIVERHLDLGADQVPGNAADPGRDGIVGTLDDPIDPLNHPANPKYKYRILYAQEIL